ncbi:hypothetical protein EJ08DRAFT_695107 [Tothia fuscella]|uniref:BRCT domain-containing protein n=1 Tax=Tothia fuscella TaxID=1048955 RepID=A0A9P4NWQ4_9PEZI|nr:hypothetical protein EJ08DRAFT_695107 [Tothia fuscella]
MKSLLKKDAIAIIGDFGQSRSAENMKRWIEANGGRYATKIEEGVTHLICTKEAWAKHTASVEKAKKIKGLKIVTYDWLEDSLNAKSHRREKEYLLTTVEKADKKLKQERKKKERSALKKDVREFNTGCKEALTVLHSGKPKKESVASLAASFFTRHAQEFKDGTSPYASKPRIEPYNAYEREGGDLLAGIDAEESVDENDGTGEEDGKETKNEKEVLGKGKDKAKVDSGTTTSITAAPSIAALNTTTDVEKAERSNSEDYKSSSMDAIRAHIEAKKRTRKPFKVPPPSRLATTFSPTPFQLSQPAIPVIRKRKTTESSPPNKSSTSSPDPLALNEHRPKYITDPIPSELDNHHLYTDRTNFTYTCILMRIDVSTNENERCLIRIFESHTLPHTYACHLQYSKTNHRSTGSILTPIGSEYHVAFKAFRDAFKEKTCREWEDRMSEVPLPPEVVGKDGGRPFQYRRPAEGEPRGMKRQKLLAPLLGGFPI